MESYGSAERMDRRCFLRSAAGTGAILTCAPAVFSVTRATEGPDPINVAVIGAGAQGKVLALLALRIPGVRFKAVCDIWEAYHLKWLSRRLQRHGYPVCAYTDYEEMLAKEEDLDAVIIATPDCWHARHAVACLSAGLHVYCETPMSNTVEGARRMVEAARETGKLVQIGQQRRSHPRYVFCREKLLKEVKLLGRVIAVNGQWNRAVHSPLGWPKNRGVQPATLKRYGYESMTHLRNWRWYKGLGSGPVVDLGSHQIDVYNWFLGARPSSVLASGRTNYYDKKTHEWYDTVMAVYEYETPEGSVTASYQILTANRHEGYFEKFLGDKGTLLLPERSQVCRLYPEPGLTKEDLIKWAVGLKEGYLTAPKAVMEMVERMSVEQLSKVLFVRETDPPPIPVSSATTPATVMSCGLSVTTDKPVHQLHLENFFDSIRGKAKLNCPAEVGYETAVTVLKVNAAAAAGRKLSFEPEEFTV